LDSYKLRLSLGFDVGLGGFTEEGISVYLGGCALSLSCPKENPSPTGEGLFTPFSRGRRGQGDEGKP